MPGTILIEASEEELAIILRAISTFLDLAERSLLSLQEAPRETSPEPAAPRPRGEGSHMRSFQPVAATAPLP